MRRAYDALSGFRIDALSGFRIDRVRSTHTIALIVPMTHDSSFGFQASQTQTEKMRTRERRTRTVSCQTTGRVPITAFLFVSLNHNLSRMRTRMQLLSFLLLSSASVVVESLRLFPILNKKHQQRTTNERKSTCKPPVIFHTQHPTANESTMSKPSKSVLQFGAKCTCGKVEVAVETLEKAPPVRMVCYCSDCRGYYESIDRLAIENGSPPSGILDNWGGVDWTALYPRDITIVKGKDLLKTTVIRPASTTRQVYASCCHTPMMRFGGMSVLLNSNLIPPEAMTLSWSSSFGEKDHPCQTVVSKLPIEFRIIGRNSWKEPATPGSKAEQPLDNNSNEIEKKHRKPPMSWSVPFRWFLIMPSRVRPDLMDPIPLEIPTVEDVKAGKVEVLKGFQPGSK